MANVRGAHYLSPVLRYTGISAMLRFARPWHGVIALNYHRIGDGRASVFDRGLWSATPEHFDRHVALLKEHCDVIAPWDLPDVVRAGRGRYALITFDDGYRDNYDHAFPILRSHGVPGTFFVATGFIDRPRLPWWDEIAWMVRTSDGRRIPAGVWLDRDVVVDEPGREQAVRTLLRTYKSIPGEHADRYVDYLAGATGSGRFQDANGHGDQRDNWMTWDMLREMRAGGMCIGGHTVNHPVLARLGADAQRAEIAGCKRRLEAELGEPMRYFSYPVGGRSSFNADTRRSLDAEGVQLAFSYYGTLRQFPDWDPLDVPRVAVEQWTTWQDLVDVLTLPQVFA